MCDNTDDCCKSGDKKICKNQTLAKTVKFYLNSNIQYVNPDNFNSETSIPWGIISLIENDKEIYWVANSATSKLTKYSRKGELLHNINIISGQNPNGLIENYTNYFGCFTLLTTTQTTVEGAHPIDINTTILINNPGSLYTGLAVTKKRLYVANFGNGRVEMYDRNFSSLGSFTDTALVNAGYHAYNVAVNKKYVYVAFARFGTDIFGIGNGYVDIFSRDGQLLFRFISRDPLNAPWGLDFSPCQKYLYVANSGDGKINVFNLCDGEFIGPLQDKNCNIVQIGGLKGIALDDNGLAFTSQMENISLNSEEGFNGLIGHLCFLDNCC